MQHYSEPERDAEPISDTCKGNAAQLNALHVAEPEVLA